MPVSPLQQKQHQQQHHQQEYYARLEASPLIIRYPSPAAGPESASPPPPLFQEIPHDHEGQPDFNRALAVIARRFHVEEDDMDAGTERPDPDAADRLALHVYHPDRGLLATLSWVPAGIC